MMREDLKFLKNMSTKEIGEEFKERIIDYCLKPSCAGWSDIQNIIINPEFEVMTLWQLLIDIDHTFPSVGRIKNLKGKIIEEWKKIPTASQICQAIQYVAD